ncbi:hypothetical protein [Erwinia phyllosphaerae]|uniref:hypothetical protein n=1 Tax=Erwinia phyllosphaerae TaxID=2853256 RepID=UPI001FEF6B46|nr:hypothetical protein [Erwinia phyllosphaerae]MBV4368613.1 hypothetical protein [Erwinia phyllosphaerae]
MKIGGGLSGAFGGGAAGGAEDAGTGAAKLLSGESNAKTAGNVLNFGSSSSNGTGVEFGSKDALTETSNGQSTSSESSITQLLNAIMELLKNSGANSDKSGSGSGTGNGSSGTQDASGSSDIMTQLMDMIKKMLGQSSEGTSSADQGNTSSSSGQSGNGSQEQSQDSSGLAGKLGGALQMLGLGAILSAISGGSGSQGSGESK